MAAGREAEILRPRTFSGRNSAPSDTPREPPRSLGSSWVRRTRLVMRRFLVGRLYRRQDRGGHFYARVTDLWSGKVFRMSTGETSRKRAEEGLRLRLKLMTEAESARAQAELAARPPTPEQAAMNEAVEMLTGESPSAPAAVTVEVVEDETHRAAAAATAEAARLAERGRYALTRDDALQLAQAQPESQPRHGPPLEEAFANFLATKDIAASTLDDYKRSGKFFVRILGNRPVNEITGLDVQNFLNDLRDGKIGRGPKADLKRSQRTRQKHLRLLRDFFQWCEHVAEYVESDPTKGIVVKVKRNQRKKRRKGLGWDEARRLLMALRQKPKQRNHDLQYVWMASFLALRTGFRRGNILGLRWDQVDLNAGTIRIPCEEYRKRDLDEDFVVPMSNELWRVLRLWKVLRRRSPLVKDKKLVLGVRVSEFKNAFREAAKRAGVETDFHNLRHAFKSLLRKDGVEDPKVRDDLAGHAPRKSAEQYEHIDIDDLRKAANRLRPVFGPKARALASESKGAGDGADEESGE